MSKDSGNSLGIGGLIIGILMAVFVLGAGSAISKPALTSGEEINIQDTKIYSQVKKAYKEYCEENIQNNLLEMAKKKKSKNHDNKVVMKRTDPNAAYFLAFLLVENDERKVDLKKIKFDKKAIFNFLDKTMHLKNEKKREKGEDVFYVTSHLINAEKFAEVLGWKEIQGQEYVISYESIQEELGEEDEEVLTEYVEVDKSYIGQVPHYLQYDRRWGSNPYGTTGSGKCTIAAKGCAPTCVAMIVSYFLQKEVFPNEIVDWSGDRYYVPGAGTSTGMYPAAAEKYGLITKSLGNSITQVMEELKAGKIVIASCSPGIFTSGGHMIVLRGLDKQGNIMVNDPNDNNMKNHYNTPFAPGTIARECKYYYSFWKDGFVPVPAEDDELYLMAQIVKLEAGGTGESGMTAVAELIKNRVESSKFPNTIREVVSQRGQFTTYQKINGVSPTQEQLTICTEVINGKRAVLNDKDCLYFCSKEFYLSTSSRWWHSLKFVADFGNWFFKE